MDQVAADVVVKRGFSQTFYRERLHEIHYGYPDLESFMVGFWEGWATSKGDWPSPNGFSASRLTRADPENMLVMLQTWQSGDCSLQEPYNGRFEEALSSIKAKTLVLPAKTDLYFP